MRTDCGASSREGSPCKAAPIKGGNRCGRHGGGSFQTRHTVEQRLAARVLENTETTLGVREKYPEVDPGPGRLRRHTEWSGVPDVCKQDKVIQCVQVGYWTGRVVDVQSPVSPPITPHLEPWHLPGSTGGFGSMSECYPDSTDPPCVAARDRRARNTRSFAGTVAVPPYLHDYAPRICQ